jgi:hypothetical protein
VPAVIIRLSKTGYFHQLNQSGTVRVQALSCIGPPRVVGATNRDCESVVAFSPGSSDLQSEALVLFDNWPAISSHSFFDHPMHLCH